MKETRFIEKLPEIIRECLSDVPWVTVSEIRREPDTLLDYVANIRVDERPYRLAFEAKSQGQPRFAREAVNNLLQLVTTAAARDACPVFVAPYISPAAAKICRERNVGYLDQAGNCRLVFDRIYISREGRVNPFKFSRSLKTIYQPVSSRVLRVLLAKPKAGWKLVDLQKEAEVSLGQVYNVKEALLDREWVEASDDGIRLQNPQALLDDWAKNYTFRKNTVFDFYSLKSLSEIEVELASVCQREKIEYALTSFSAAARLAPAVRYKRACAYVHYEINKVSALLDLKPVTSGANVSLFAPYDKGVFYGGREVESARVVSPVQAYLDLVGFRGRGDEAAEAVRRQVIEPSW